MDYKNQLINTGQINDVGYSVHTNIKDSYRKGIELMYDIKITKNIKWNGNVTLSDNKIEKHSEFVDNWDTWMQQEVDYENTNIAFSPNIISKSKISYKIGKLEAAWIFKHIGKQYIDNTQSEERMLESYSLNNILFSYELQHVDIKKASISLQINNIFNNSYVNRAWVYRFNSNDNQLGDDPYINADSDGYNMIGYFPQATRNYLVGLSLYL
jgi:iron complex outermembrane receptor protein